MLEFLIQSGYGKLIKNDAWLFVFRKQNLVTNSIVLQIPINILTNNNHKQFIYMCNAWKILNKRAVYWVSIIATNILVLYAIIRIQKCLPFFLSFSS